MRCKIVVLLTLVAAICVLSFQSAWSDPMLAFTNAFPALTFDRPLFLTAVPGSDLLAVEEQGGRVYAFQNLADVSTKSVMLDVYDRITDGGEKGLLGLAFDPQFVSNGFMYVNYTADNPLRTVIARYHVADGVADLASETILLTFDQPFANHNGGMLAFGPDGMLYIAAGDGGSGDDPHNNGQSLSTVLGKILRINPTPGAIVPLDNPFASTPDARGEIWAYGLRNPWRFSFDRADGTLWAGDVGQNKWEEVDVITKGGNYGWRVFEATHSNINPDNRSGIEFISPIWEYGHDQGLSITGGYVYRGKAVPSAVGFYFCADYLTGRVWALKRNPDGTPNVAEVAHVWTPSSFGEDANGELYITSFDGHVYRMVARTAE